MKSTQQYHRWVYARHDLPMVTRAVGSVVVSFMRSPNDVPFSVSVEQIASVVGLSQRSVKAHLKALVEAGVFHRERPSRREPMRYYPLTAEWSPVGLTTEWSPVASPPHLRVVNLEAPSGEAQGSPLLNRPKGLTEERTVSLPSPEFVAERMAEIRRTLHRG